MLLLQPRYKRLDPVLRALPGSFPNRAFEVGRGLLLDDVVFDARDESHHVIAFPLRHVELLQRRREVFLSAAQFFVVDSRERVLLSF